ncbi:hypothetical protein DMENIID0001_004490 [Sergentomyia squamirostris]
MVYVRGVGGVGHFEFLSERYREPLRNYMRPSEPLRRPWNAFGGLRFHSGDLGYLRPPSGENIKMFKNVAPPTRWRTLMDWERVPLDIAPLTTALFECLSAGLW